MQTPTFVHQALRLLLCLLAASATSNAQTTSPWSFLEGRTKYDAFFNQIAVDFSKNIFVLQTSAEVGRTKFFEKHQGVSGKLLWRQPLKISLVQDFALDQNGDGIVSGTLRTGDSYSIYTVKFSGSSGQVLWEKLDKAGTTELFGTALAVDSHGDLLLTGHSIKPGQPQSFCYTAKYAGRDGSTLWTATDPQSNSIGSAIAVDKNDDVVVTGSKSIPPADGYTIKYRGSSGAVVWKATYDGAAHLDDYLSKVQADSQANVIVSGSTVQPRSGASSVFAMVTVKYSGVDGSAIWSNTKGTNGASISDMAVDQDGDVIVTGGLVTSPVVFPPPSVHPYTAKYAGANGAVIWETLLNNCPYGFGVTLAVDASRNVHLGGQANRVPNNPLNGYLATYAANTGQPIWEAFGNPAGKGCFLPSAVAVDSSGGTVFTGSLTDDSGFERASLTVKYLTNDLWQTN